MKCKNQSVYFRFFHWPWEKLKVQQQKPEASQCSRGRGKPLVEEILQENRRTVWTFPAIEVSFKQRPRYKVKGLGFHSERRGYRRAGPKAKPSGAPLGQDPRSVGSLQLLPFLCRPNSAALLPTTTTPSPTETAGLTAPPNSRAAQNHKSDKVVLPLEEASTFLKLCVSWKKKKNRNKRLHTQAVLVRMPLSPQGQMKIWLVKNHVHFAKFIGKTREAFNKHSQPTYLMCYFFFFFFFDSFIEL